MNALKRNLRTFYPGLLGIAISMATWAAALAQYSPSSRPVSARESRTAALQARPYGASHRVIGSAQRPQFSPSSVVRSREGNSYEALPPGAVIVGEEDHTYSHGGYIESDFGGCGGCDEGCYSCDEGCSDCYGWNLNMICLPLPRLNIDNLTLWAGVHGAKNASYLGRAGFGFEEGLNLGGPLPVLVNSEISYQVGVNFVQSELSGNQFNGSTRKQTYFTAGLFRRVDCGLQGGAVVDYLKDRWYLADYELTQIRAEISWVYPCNHELGFMFTGSSEEGETLVGTIGGATNPTIRTQDLYALFYRRQLDRCTGGEFRFYGGATGYGEGVLGGNISLPINDCLALDSFFDYRIPKEDNGNAGSLNEGWYVGIRMVWTPGRFNSSCGPCNYNRPLFDVANPGSMMVDRW